MEKKGVRLFCTVLISVLIMSANTVQSITCLEAVAEVMGCLPYLLLRQGAPSAACCEAVAYVNQQASTTQVRRELCYCFKNAAGQYKVDPQRAELLPEQCHVKVAVPIRPDTDCDHIQEVN